MPLQQTQGILPQSVMDGVDRFYGLPLPEFTKAVNAMVGRDQRLHLIFYASRQRYRDGNSMQMPQNA